jgi:hypothetical protein
MKNLPIVELYLIKNRLIKKGMKNDPMMTEVLEAICIKEKMILEDGGGTSATGGPAVGGMGQVVSAQPSGLAGATIGTNWASGGGTVGSGDISAPYNPSGANRVFQSVEMGKNHGAMTGKKTRKKKISMKSLKDIFSKRADFMADQEKSGGSKKVMNFNDFKKDDIIKVKK